MKIGIVGPEFFHKEGQADGGTDGETEKYDNAIRKFVNNLKVTSKHSKCRSTHSMPCPFCAHAFPLPCRAAKGLESVFPI